MEEPTPKQLSIVAALAADVLAEVREMIDSITPFINEKIQFLVDADIIDEEEGSDFLKAALHVGIDFAMEEQDEYCDDEDEDEDEDEASEACSLCGGELEDEDEDSDERAY